MAFSIINQISTKIDLPLSTELLPARLPLFPPSGSQFHIQTEPKSDMTLQFEQAKNEFRQLTDRTSGLLSDGTMTIKKVALLASAEGVKVSKKAWYRAGSIANMLSITLKDKEIRATLIATHGKKAIVLLLAVCAVGVGGWFYLAHQATRLAKDRLEEFIYRNKLQNNLSYKSISASPFGSVLISQIKFNISPDTIVLLRSLNFSYLEMENNIISKIDLLAEEFNVPLLKIIRRNQVGRVFDSAIGLGYTTLTGDLSFKFDYSEQEKTSFAIDGKIHNMGKMSVAMRFDDLSRDSVAQLLQFFSERINQADLFSNIDNLQMFNPLIFKVKLSNFSLVLDSSDIHKRIEMITNDPLPSGLEKTKAMSSELTVEDLVRGGMELSIAKNVYSSIEAWQTKGETLRVDTNIKDSIPLFDGYSINPAFTQLAPFIIATNSKISN